MKKYALTETQIKKVVDKIVAEQEGQTNELYKKEGHKYEFIKIENYGVVKAGKDGILGDNDVFIPWNIIIKLFKKFRS